MKLYKKIICIIILLVLMLDITTISLAEADIKEIDEKTANIMYEYIKSDWEGKLKDTTDRANKLKELCNNDITQLKKLAKDYGDVANRIKELTGKDVGTFSWMRRYFSEYFSKTISCSTVTSNKQYK